MHRIVAAFMVTGVLFAGVAEAQTPEGQQEARTHFDRGLALFNQQHFDGALAEFQRAYELSRRPSVLYNLGVTRQALHRYPEAARDLEEYLRLAPDLPPARRAQVTQALTELRALIAYVRVEVTPEGAALAIDDEPVTLGPDRTLAVGPGRHTVEATAPEYETHRQVVTIASGETRTVTLTLRPRATGIAEPRVTPTPSPATASLLVRRLPPGATVRLDGQVVDAARALTLAVGDHRVEVVVPGSEPWVGSLHADAGGARAADVRVVRPSGLPRGYFLSAVAATGVFLASGAVFGALTLSTRDELDQYYRDQASTPAVQDLVSRGETWRTLTNVMFGAAALTAIGSVVLLPLTRFRGSGLPRVEVGFTPLGDGAAARLGGTF